MKRTNVFTNYYSDLLVWELYVDDKEGRGYDHDATDENNHINIYNFKSVISSIIYQNTLKTPLIAF